MKLCVILPVYNAEKYLEDCLNSVFSQTFRDFLIIAIDDKSTDNSLKILQKLAKQDERLKVFTLDENQGEAGAPYIATQLAYQYNPEYIARMDADDICLETRFEKQIAYLEQHQSVDILGTNLVTLSQNGKSEVIGVPLIDDIIKAHLMLAANNIFNATTIWRTRSIRPLNLPRYQLATASDYATWVDCALNNKKFANLSEPLYVYRQHNNNISKKLDIAKHSVQVTMDKWNNFVFPELENDEKELLSRVFNPFNRSFQITNSEWIKLCAIPKKMRVDISYFGENRLVMRSLIEKRIDDLSKQINGII
ncbi:MAG: glycosyltransferase [Pasteurella oralis]|uniref:glycosyltransferase family 2 protein n=1 Tax=Pasteurella oralis TaxID=1071947 RepID=UPI002710D1FE|nr:glycosyltransferase [Pasteurella oralis]